MKSYKGLLFTFAAVALLTGCAKEAPFSAKSVEETGTLNMTSLTLTLTNAGGTETGTRADVPSTDDFKVVITRQGSSAYSSYSSNAGSVEYKYSEMPEVLTLPVGKYKVYAHHGDNKPCAWEEPYYYGESSFDIGANKITDDVDPIIAKLSNIRVSIVFHPSLLSAMSDDSKVDVKVGDQTLTFTPTEKRSAYFKYLDNSQTIAATFRGEVDGSQVEETHTDENVAPGNHYRITFRLHGVEDDDPGNITGSVAVDTSVVQIDMNHSIDGEQEEYYDDDKRPNQGGGDDPAPVGPKPRAEALEPTGDYAVYKKLDLDADNKITDDLYCAWKVISEAEGGFNKFDVEIYSTTLTPGELSGVGLVNESEDPEIFKMNLINPGKNEESLNDLGFPVYVGEKTSAEFNITGFLPMMKGLGPGKHEFRLIVGDKNGTSVISIKLHND